MADSYDQALRYRAIESFRAGQFDTAIALFDELVEITDDARDHSWRAHTLLLLGRYEESYATYLRVLEIYPDDAATLHHLAYICSASPDSSLRDGKKALGYATRACELTSWKHWPCLSVLAAAYAELFDWRRAQLFAKQALKCAPEQERSDRELAVRLYQDQQPYRANHERDQERLRPRLTQWQPPWDTGDSADNLNQN